MSRVTPNPLHPSSWPGRLAPALRWPFKDTAGPAMNILIIKVMTIVSLIFAPSCDLGGTSVPA